MCIVGNNPLKYSDKNGLEPRPTAAPLETPWLDDGPAIGVPSAKPWWQHLLDGAYDFAVGWGDGASFGATGLIRNWLGIPSYVDDGSFAYGLGKIGGMVNGSFVVSGGAGRLWSATRGRALRIPQSKNTQIIRIESGNVHLIPGVAKTKIPKVLHFHIFLIDSLHLPYQLWPWLLAFYLAEKLDQYLEEIGAVPLAEPQY